MIPAILMIKRFSVEHGLRAFSSVLSDCPYKIIEKCYDGYVERLEKSTQLLSRSYRIGPSP